MIDPVKKNYLLQKLIIEQQFLIKYSEFLIEQIDKNLIRILFIKCIL